MEGSDIQTTLQNVYRRVDEAKSRRKQIKEDVCIVAVSKTKPKASIIALNHCGHQDFGENYVAELAEKASDPEIRELCPDIKWHFIGHLQSNKVNKLLGKSGVSPDEVVDLVQHVLENCHHVSLAGLMLIGYANHDLKLGPNPEFQMLSELKGVVCEKFNIEPEKFGLSMGMSQDFEHAIDLGSNYVRVGTSIFGARQKKAES